MILRTRPAGKHPRGEIDGLGHDASGLLGALFAFTGDAGQGGGMAQGSPRMGQSRLQEVRRRLQTRGKL
jgi:hypothetical protein